MTELHQHTFHALGSHNELAIYSSDAQNVQRLFSLAEAEVRRIETKYSRYLPDSIVSRINGAAGVEPVTVDDETARLIDFAAACYQQSDGLFDSTSGVLRQAWNFKEKYLPQKDKLTELLSRVGWQHVIWDSPGIFLKLPGMELDFGGFGKEYAVDQAAALLTSQGVQSGYVNLGGDLRVIGLPPGRNSWSFGIAHPRRSGELALSLEMTSGALASSGDYERFFELDGRRYCHILNPKTGYPVNDLQAVSVIAPASMIAGSCSTTAMLLGKKQGKKFLARTGFPFVIIDRDGQITHG